jgi:hypothetical protein
MDGKLSSFAKVVNIIIFVHFCGSQVLWVNLLLSSNISVLNSTIIDWVSILTPIYGIVSASICFRRAPIFTPLNVGLLCSLFLVEFSLGHYQIGVNGRRCFFNWYFLVYPELLKSVIR